MSNLSKVAVEHPDCLLDDVRMVVHEVDKREWGMVGCSVAELVRGTA